MDKKVAFKNNTLVDKARLDKAGFQNDMGHGNFKDLPERKASENVLIEYYVINHLILLKIQNMMDINEVLVQWFIIF